MKPELEQQLIERFPGMFRDYDKPGTQSLLCFGCECRDGWYQIIYDTCSVLEQLGVDVKFVQIKEKFGGLRMYYRCGHLPENRLLSAVVFHVISAAEDESFYTCETCGTNEPERQIRRRTVNGGYWIRTECKLCHTQREQEARRL